MRKLSALTFFLSTLTLNAQTSPYLTDLAALRSTLQKTPSYKAQIRGKKHLLYSGLYNRLVSDTVSDPNSHHYFYNLAQLVFPLRDNHLGFYQLPNYKNFETQESIDRFVATKEFLDYPSYNIAIDSLNGELVKKPADSIEGIYYYDTFYSVGLFKNRDNEYIGVVLDSDISLWRKGQIAIHLYEYAPNLYKAIYGHPLHKNFILQTNEKYKDQSLVNSYFYASYSQNVYSKRWQQADYVNLPRTASRFEFRNIAGNIQYLMVRSFQADRATMQTSHKFYDSIKNSLKASYLVLDLRNNEGGARKEMRTYYKLLKKYTRKGQLYVLLNNGTLSQAEIFTLKLKKLKNVTTVGQATKGMLTFTEAITEEGNACQAEDLRFFQPT